MKVKCPKCLTDNPDTQKFCGECSTPLPAGLDVSQTKTLEPTTKKLSPGITFAGRYEVIEELGKGGMGRVYRVCDTQINQELALKVLRPEIAMDKTIIERFRNELKIARKITHKNICRTHDINETDGTPYITMELVKGESLKNYILKRGHLSEKEAIFLAKQVCEGLSEAHELGIVHRDLKPHNIMIDEKGQMKIMDFGIACSTEIESMTQSGVIIGTPEYISPEQAEGEEVDHRSDIYALGVVLYEMVTGSTPFKGNTALSIALKHKNELPQDPQKINPDISNNLRRLILVCMEKDRKRRYQTAKTLLSDLLNIEEGLPLGTKINPTKKSIPSMFLKKKFFFPVLAAGLLTTILLIWHPWAKDVIILIPSDKPTIAVLPFDDKSLQKDQEALCDGIADTLIAALTRIDGLFVPAQTSAFSFKGKERDYKEISNKLNVRYLLEGSLQKEGDILRITARIIDLSNGSIDWSEKFDGKEGDIFEIQDQISFAVVNNLKIKLAKGAANELTKHHTENSDAYDLYIKGRFYFSKRNHKNLETAIEFFKGAIELDSQYALAYIGIADAYMILGENLWASPKEIVPKAETAVKNALEIDPHLAEAKVSSARMKMWFYRDFIEAEKDFIQAIVLNPGNSMAHASYAFFLSYFERFDEAIPMIEKARELDPLSTRTRANVGLIYCFAQQYNKAIEELLKVRESNPLDPATNLYFDWIYTMMGNYDDALASIQRVLDVLGEIPPVLLELAYILALQGERDEAGKLLIKVMEDSRSKFVPLSSIAAVYGALGEYDKAFEWLEKAYEERDPKLSYLRIYPKFKPLRSDPRYFEWLKKLDLEK